MCVCFARLAGSALCDRRTPLPQFRGLLHGAGPHHRSGGQKLMILDFRFYLMFHSLRQATCLLCVWILSDVFPATGGHFQREPAAWRLGVGHVVQSSDGRAEGEGESVFKCLWKWKWLNIVYASCQFISQVYHTVHYKHHAGPPSVCSATLCYIPLRSARSIGSRCSDKTWLPLTRESPASLPHSMVLS